MPPEAVLFISFGGPEQESDIMPFLERVTLGRGIPRERLLEVAEHYRHLGGRSPINEITRRQAAALEKALADRGRKLPVFIGQRNWHPLIEDTLRTMAAQGIRHAIGFTTAAHRSEASLERYIKAVEAARERVGPTAPVIDYVDPWFDHPLFIDALAARVQEALEAKNQQGGESAQAQASGSLLNAPWCFVAHSIPCSMAKASTYVEELRWTAEQVAARFGKKEWTLAYSSRSGRPEDPWLAPDINDVIREAAARGAKDILMITIGFVADHVEVLYDQDVEARETATEVGIGFYRAQTVNDHPLFIRMMAEVVTQRLTATPHPAQRESALTRCHNGREQAAVGTASPTCFCNPGAADPPCRKPLAARRPPHG